MNSEEMKEALKLAGKVAIHARLVVEAHIKELSLRVNELENALDEYNNFIVWKTNER